jgi:capsular polysaccharide biosynthesis protein
MTAEARSASAPLLARHEQSLGRLAVPVTDAVLLIRDDVPAVANAFAARFPAADIHVLGARRNLNAEEASELDQRVIYTYASSESERLGYLMGIRAPQVVIEAGNRKRAHKLSSLRQFLFFVAPGGLYIIDELDSVHHPKYDDKSGPSVLDVLSDIVWSKTAHLGNEGGTLATRELAAAVEEITIRDRYAVLLRSAVDYFVKLRDWEADAVLTRRYGSRWGTVIEDRPATTFIARGTVTSHGDGPIPSGRAKYRVPERFIRRYSEVTCTARQIVRYGRFVLPDSWRHPHQRVLNNRQLVHTSPYVGRYLDTTAPTSKRKLDGTYYYLDTELPGHFGHITTEVLSRAWGWELVRELDPTVKALVSVSRPGDVVPGFQQLIFSGLGISPEDVEIIGPREEVQVECLYAATPQLENPFYVDPDITRTWQRLDKQIPDEASVSSERIFISRREAPKRHCRETPEIEEFFAGHGFKIVYPEDLPYPAQKAMFKQARIIAGFGGSGLFNMMYAPTATIVIISGDSYTAENERLFAAANGNDLHYFWGRSDVSMPQNGRFSLSAFTSGFTFDLNGHAEALRTIIG